jgi:hypothetical protein
MLSQAIKPLPVFDEMSALSLITQLRRMLGEPIFKRYSLFETPSLLHALAPIATIKAGAR